MRILIVHDFYQQPGGEDAVVLQEMALLQSKGHEVFLSSRHNDDIVGFLRKASTAVLAVYNPFAKRRLADKLKEIQPDIVHVHNFFPQLSPAIFDACSEARVPSVMTLHNFRILCPTSFLYHDSKLRERSLQHSAFWTVPRRVYRNSYIGTFVLACMVDFHKMIGTWKTKVDRFIALSEFSRNKFIEGGLPLSLIVVKHNTINQRPEIESAESEREGALFVGRLSEEKGLQTLLDAWRRVDYRLRIGGDGPLMGFCQSAQNERITVLGRISPEQVRTEMAHAAFLVLPSTWYEMFPVTLVEAYAAGLPVIASNLGGLSEMVKHMRTGLTFEPANSDDLVEKVQWAIAHPREMVEMGRNARAEFERRYAPELAYENLMNIYKDVIECRLRQLYPPIK